jgi:hypothetical protein
MPSQTRKSSRLKSSAAKKIQKHFKSKKRRIQIQRQRSSATRKIQLRARAKIQGNKARTLITRVRDSIATDNNCSICFEPMSNNVATALPCGHRFHKHCIVNWLSRSQGKCSLCRSDVTNIPYTPQPPQAQAQALDLEQLIEQLLSRRSELEILEHDIALQTQQLPDPPEIPNIDFIQALDNIIRALELVDAVLDLSNRVNTDAVEIYRSFNINDEIVEQDINNILIRTAELLTRARNNTSNAQRIAEHINNPGLRR